MAELKPCPFCGERIHRTKGFGGLNFFKCRNTACGAVVSFDNDYYNLHKDEAIKAWNRRHKDAADVVSRAVYEQTAWERDIAMEQLAAHGIGFVEECEAKGTNCTPAVVRCRDCIYYHPKTGWCDELSFFQTADGAPCSPDESADWKMFMEDDFCSRGKRR